MEKVCFKGRFPPHALWTQCAAAPDAAAEVGETTEYLWGAQVMGITLMHAGEQVEQRTTELVGDHRPQDEASGLDAGHDVHLSPAPLDGHGQVSR